MQAWKEPHGETHRTRGPCLDGAPPHIIHWSTVRLCGLSGQLVSSTTLHHRAPVRDRHPPPVPTTAHRLSRAQALRFPDPSHSV